MAEVILPEVKFTDIEGHWAKDYIEFLAAREIIKGVSEDRFEPDREITRGEFVALIIRLFGLQPVNDGGVPFKDVSPHDWYYSAVKAAYQHGIVNGTGVSTFSPGESITREQMVTIVIKLLEKRGIISRLQPVNRDIGLYADRGDISAWAVDNVAKALRYGIITGRSEDVLAPGGSTTRAEAATIIRKIYDILLIE